jgi:competence protein ComEC
MFKKKKIIYSSLGFLFILTVFIWAVIFSQLPDGILTVHFFDVGQGDAIFIETDSDKQLLIDGGPDKTILEKLNEVMPTYDRKIDLIILTHPDADHLAGLVSVLEYFEIGHIITSGLKKDTAIYQKWQELIQEKNIPLSLAQSGQKIILANNVTLEIFWPEQSLIKNFSKKANNVSVVSKLAYEEIDFLFSGDIEKKVENYLVNNLETKLEADILKIPHHGSKTSSIDDFLRAVDPEVAVISVGRNNRYGHPNQEVLGRLQNYVVYRTDQNEDIKISTDGFNFKVDSDL